MKYVSIISLGLALIASVPTGALAAGAGVTGDVSLTGIVTQHCAGGTLSAASGAFDLGVLIDTSTGFLSTALAAPAKILVGSFCSTNTKLTISATPLTAQSYTQTPPTGFSRAVNYTAAASGWTAAPAVYTTNAAANPNAVQTRSSAFSGNITVAVSGFQTSGGNTLRLVADPVYQGVVTVTLAAN